MKSEASQIVTSFDHAFQVFATIYCFIDQQVHLCDQKLEIKLNPITAYTDK
jgi:hypothetical protein